MSNAMPCKVCGASAQSQAYRGAGPLEYVIECSRCGTYFLKDDTLTDVENLRSSERGLVAEWIFSQQGASPPSLNVDTLQFARSRTPQRFAERANRLLLAYARRDRPLDWSRSHYESLASMLQTTEAADVSHLTMHLVSEKLAEVDVGQTLVRLTSKGIIRAEELLSTVPDSTQGFVAMWFDPSMDEAWEKGLSEGIRLAGYRPFRISQKEHANKICDEIVAEIRRSRFVVTDYTGHRGGVYYEAGYAAGRGLQVISTCRKDEMSGLHFDIRQYNCIDWAQPQELAERLAARVSAVLGDGPLRGDQS